MYSIAENKASNGGITRKVHGFITLTDTQKWNE